MTPETKYNQKCETYNISGSKNKLLPLPQNCKDLKEKGYNSGIYRIQPNDADQAFMVMCNMNIKQGGWTYIHNRYEGREEFYLNWQDYKHGFGNLAGEFWLGLEHIYELTGNK